MLDFSHIQANLQKKSKQTWQGVEVVDYFKRYLDIPDKGKFGYTYWLRLVKDNGVTIYHAPKLMEIMLKREDWLLKEKKEKLPREKWLFNRFRYDIKEKGVDKFISSNS